MNELNNRTRSSPEITDDRTALYIERLRIKRPSVNLFVEINIVSLGIRTNAFLHVPGRSQCCILVVEHQASDTLFRFQRYAIARIDIGADPRITSTLPVERPETVVRAGTGHVLVQLRSASLVFWEC